MKPHFDTITIVGVGLLGASIGLAAKRRGIATRIIGVGRRRESLQVALDRRAIDDATTDASSALKECDLAIICTPASLVPSYLDVARKSCARDAIVTDVASTKSAICEHASKTWPSPRRFVGSHPMAGSEKFGPEHATETLFEDSVVFVERGDNVDSNARERVAAFWTALGARTFDVDPIAHDRLVARTSHIPHIAASALTQLLDGHGADAPAFIGNGFRDTTRIAEGRAEIWRDISMTNADAIAEGLDQYIRELEGFREQLRAQSSQGVEDFFERGRKARIQAIGESKVPCE